MITAQGSQPDLRSARFFRHVLWLVAICFVTNPDALADSPCTIGLPSSVITPTIDGIKGTQWSDAAVLSSGEPCLGLLGDTGGSRIVRVYSKRYGSNVGFLFEIPDTTQSGPCSMGKLCVGDRIVLQFDSDKSRGTGLAGGNPLYSRANDLQIVISYKGADGSGGVLELATTIYARSDPMGFCSPPVWDDITTSVTMNQPEVAVRTDQPLPGAGYTAEIRIPLALLGTPVADFGFAFAVINDIGDSMTCPSGVCSAYAISFPNSLTISNVENPVTPGCSGWGNWIVPNTWGTATFGLAPGVVSVDRTPDYWSNDGLRVLECAGGPTYQWHKDNPCRARLEARLTNSTGVDQTRNLLFLWSPYGTGEPTDYHVAGLLKGVVVPNGVNVGPFSVDWSGMTALIGIANHPCVRVYVLPPNFLAGFTEAQMLAITSKTGVGGVDDMVTVYSLGIDQWTQKNISATAPPVCPDAACRVAANDMKEQKPLAVYAQAGQASAAPAGHLLKVSRTSTTDGLLSRGGSLLRAVYESPSKESPTAQPQNPGGNRPPKVPRPGNNILLGREERAQFSRNNVIVQVRTFGYSKSLSKHVPRYNFIENLGGIIQLIPVDMLEKLREVPFQFNVVNVDVERTIYHVVDLYLPGSVAQAEVSLNTQPTVYNPNETRVATGIVSLPGRTGGAFKRWGLSLHAGMSIPHGDFNTLFDPGPNFAVDLEYRLTPIVSLEAIYGLHHFGGGTFGQVSVGDLNVHQFSFNGKVYGTTSPVRPFFNFGGGAYRFGSGGGTNGGVNIGGGLQFDVTPNLAFEGLYNLHNVFTTGSNVRFSAVQGGLRFRF